MLNRHTGPLRFSQKLVK